MASICGIPTELQHSTSPTQADGALRARPYSETDMMDDAFEPTQDPGWVLSHEGYDVLTESALESRFALGNGFLGMRAARSVSRGPTWVGWLGYSRWASWPRCYRRRPV